MKNDPLVTVATNLPAWGRSEKELWLSKQVIKRSYAVEVLSKIKALSESFDIVQYGELSIDAERYPLFIAKNKHWCEDARTILVTGGVHGYETSGVQGALRFLQNEALAYTKSYNIVVAPCVSPWGYETINRWNAQCIDPNRSFNKEGNSEEAVLLMAAIRLLNADIQLHMDLHETTDTDNSEFVPAKDARDGTVTAYSETPDGFYLVGDEDINSDELFAFILKKVAQVTHIAPEDEHGCIIGTPITQYGVINYPVKALGLCAGFSNAQFNCTTEVYPDSARADDETCILAQVIAVKAAIEFIS
ncbi:MAG: M14 family metallocarboxypeptidase [Oceanospirillaceae bacterium]